MQVQPYLFFDGRCEEALEFYENAVGATVLASGGRNGGQPKFEGFALTLNAKNEADADRLFNALADGGEVTQPLTKTFFSPRFGMLADKFGVHWIVIAAQ
jgi:PhnB protein